MQLPDRSLTKGRSWWKQFAAESSFCEVERDRDRKRRFPSLSPADKMGAGKIVLPWSTQCLDNSTLRRSSAALLYWNRSPLSVGIPEMGLPYNLTTECMKGKPIVWLSFVTEVGAV